MWLDSIRGDEKGNAPRLRKRPQRAQTPDIGLDRALEMPFERLARAAGITGDEPVEDLQMLGQHQIDLFVEMALECVMSREAEAGCA